MKRDLHSKYTLETLLKQFREAFDAGMPNQVYLEDQLERLNKQAGFYDLQSKKADLPARLRARNRDLYQNARGLVKGIEFGIAFMLQSEEDLDALVRGTHSAPDQEPVN